MPHVTTTLVLGLAATHFMIETAAYEDGNTCETHRLNVMLRLIVMLVVASMTETATRVGWTPVSWLIVSPLVVILLVQAVLTSRKYVKEMDE